MKALTPPLHQLDERRLLAILPSHDEAISFALEDFISCANQAIQNHDFFAVALSGGSTPKQLFSLLAREENRNRVDWQKVKLFWSDERSVPPDHPDSNYKMAMDAGFASLPLIKEQIHRMHAEENIEDNAKRYEEIIQKELHGHPFDLVMLGMGDDGHTASLFPHTQGLKEVSRLVIANEVPQKKTWRMSFTYSLINSSHNIRLYVIGKGKSETLADVLLSPLDNQKYPSQKIGSTSHPALWVMDREASQDLLERLK